MFPKSSTSAAALPHGEAVRNETNLRAASCGSAPDRIEARFRLALRESPDLLPHGSSVLVAYSGGSDSVALLRLLRSVRGTRRLALSAAHFDHGLQAGSAERAARAAETCRRAGVPCEVGRGRGIGRGQAQLRAARYTFLDGAAQRARADRVALAHQLDDQIETVLINLLRGTGLRGLAGIPARRGIFARPLLGFTREELRGYIRAGAGEWLTDPANRDLRYTRSRVRRLLIPVLRGAGSQEVLNRLASDALGADRGLDRRAAELRSAACFQTTEAGARIVRSRLLRYDRGARTRILRRTAREMGRRLSRRGAGAGAAFIRNGASGHGVDVADGLRVEREFDRIEVRRARDGAAEGPSAELEIESPAPGAGALQLAGRRYEVRWGELAGAERWATAFPRGALRFPLRVRSARPGDRISARAGTRRLKKLFNERRVPASERLGVPVVAAADETVLWVVGHAAIETPAPERRRRGGDWFAVGIVER